MAKQTRRWNPGDAANVFVRVILSDAGAKLGGLTEMEWDETSKWFGGRCAYTGDALVDGRMDRDHAIPMNRTHCGLHLYGNVLPATKEANRQKAAKHYRDFVEDPDRLERIESFVRESGYWERVSVFGDLQCYCEAQYRSIDALCRVNRHYLASLLPEDLDDGLGGDPEASGLVPDNPARGDILPITLDPPTGAAFKDALLREREARIFEIHRDGRTIELRWDARNMSESSNVVGNPAKPSAIPERCLEAPRHPVPNCFRPAAVKGSARSVTLRARSRTHAARLGSTRWIQSSPCREPMSDGSSVGCRSTLLTCSRFVR